MFFELTFQSRILNYIDVQITKYVGLHIYRKHPNVIFFIALQNKDKIN